MAAYKYLNSWLQAGKGRLRLDVGDVSGLTAWAGSSHAYAVGDVVKALTGSPGWAFKCIKSGNSTTEPTWGTPYKDQMYTDGAGPVFQAYSKGVVAAICTSTYTPDESAHVYLSDLTNEVSGGNYVRKYVSTMGQGGLTTFTVTDTATNNVGKLDFDDIVWSTLTMTNGRYLVLAVDYGTDSLSPLVGFDDMGAQSPAGVTFTYQVSASGFLTYSTAAMD